MFECNQKWFIFQYPSPPPCNEDTECSMRRISNYLNQLRNEARGERDQNTKMNMVRKHDKSHRSMFLFNFMGIWALGFCMLSSYPIEM